MLNMVSTDGTEIDLIVEIIYDDNMSILFDAPYLVDGDEELKKCLKIMPMKFINNCDEYEGISLLMRYCDELWFDGVKILLDNKVDINIKNEDGLTAFMCVMNTYNNMMEQIIVSCDSIYTLNSLNIINSMSDLDDLNCETIDKIMKKSNLILKHGKNSTISDDEYVKIIKSLANRTFDGKFEAVEKIVNLFELNGLIYEQNHLLLSLNNTVNMNDYNMHFSCKDMRNYDSTRYFIEKLKNENIDIDCLTEDLICGKHNKELFKKWMSGDTNWEHYYVTRLNELE